LPEAAVSRPPQSVDGPDLERLARVRLPAVGELGVLAELEPDASSKLGDPVELLTERVDRRFELAQIEHDADVVPMELQRGRVSLLGREQERNVHVAGAR